MCASRRWTRWGRGDCEGWSLQIGNAFRGTVVRQNRGPDGPTTWRAGVNATELGEYPQRDEAMKRVEEVIEHDMRSVLSDWELYGASKRRNEE
jgi:hypothetical protein